MEPNLSTNVLKHSLLQKLSCAVTCSVLSHIILVFFYAFIVNFSLDGSEWLKATVENVTSISTWLYIIPFSSIIFAQVVICANTYMLKRTYQVTRFQKLVSVISLRTFLLAVLHVVIGGGEIWLYLFISKGRYQDMYMKCYEQQFCLRQGSIFLIVSGFWIGLYYFIYWHASDSYITFPVIHQWKLPQFKARLLPLIKQSCRSALYPAICYFILYYLCGSYIQNAGTNYFHLRIWTEEFSVYLYLSVWIFATLYIINMNLMKFFFELFLTEPFNNIDNFSLSEALLTKNIPILQHLACLDLYLLSKWSPPRRQALFTLSQPGAHPHAWNSIFGSALQLLIEFVETLNRSTDGSLTKEEIRPFINQNIELQRTLQSPILQSPMTNKHANMKNMSSLMHTPQQIDNLVQVTVEPKYIYFSDMFNSAMNGIAQSLTKTVEQIRNLKYIKYLFGELQEAHIQQCLRNGQLVIWTSHSLANIAVASFNEDPYGIIQKDLPVLIKVLVELKLSVEKLNKLPMFSRKSNGFDFSFKMKNSVSAGVRLSLANICNTFGKYINDIPLPKDVVVQLQSYI